MNSSSSTYRHPTHSDQDNNFSYYHEYCRLFLANIVLTSQMKDLISQRMQLNTRMSKLQKKAQQIQDGGTNQQDKKKRFRRTASEIERHYRCPVETCQKSYGSEGSLNQHLKLKHYELYQTMPHAKEDEEEDEEEEEASEPRKLRS